MPVKHMWTLFERVGLAFGAVVGVAALVIGLISFLGSEKAEVTAQVLANDELTMYPAVAELRGYFTYADEEVAYLWKVRVKFVNSGDKTIVGTGNQKNILGEGLNFVFPDDTRILRIEEESETLQSNMEQIEPNHFQIQFSQWRSGEYNIASFYIASERLLEAVPCPSVLTRDIINGDVIIQDLTEREPRERMSIIDRLPVPISIAGKVIGAIIIGGVALVLLILIPWMWRDSLLSINWKRHYLADFTKYVDRFRPRIPAMERRLLKEDPFMATAILESELSELEEGFWDKFEGLKPPSLNVAFGSLKQLISFTLVFLLMLFGCIILLLMVVQA